MNLRILSTLKPGPRFNPFESCPAIIICTRVPILGRSTIIDGHHNSLANADKAATEGVIDSTISRGMSKASTMEEDYNWNNLRSAQGLFKLCNAPLSLVFRGRLVNPVKEACGAINMIKAENSIHWNGVGLDFSFKELRQFAVKGPIRAAKEIICKLEIGNEDPCV
jgi:hypothetical protein